MKEKINYVATCLFGLERFVGEEIQALGYERTETIDGRVYFRGDISAIVRCNLWLRCAERVLIVMDRFSAKSFTELFDNTKNIPWENIIDKNDAFPVKGHSIQSALHSIPDCQKIIKKAVVERLKEKYKCEWFKETGVKYQIEFLILRDKAALMIDTSGLTLHKRGYRTESGIAPIRETLASALVKISRLREDTRLWDPLCGSGTIPIEAAMLMKNIAPGIKRNFAAEDFPFIEKRMWSYEREKAKSEIINDSEYFSFGTDIDKNILSVASKNAERAGVAKQIRFFEKDVLNITKDDVRSTIICNPPYGERMNSINEARELYKKMGNLFSSFSPWQIYIISSDEEFEKHYGITSDKSRKLYNGMIKCYYHQFFKKS